MTIRNHLIAQRRGKELPAQGCLLVGLSYRSYDEEFVAWPYLDGEGNADMPAFLGDGDGTEVEANLRGGGIEGTRSGTSNKDAVALMEFAGFYLEFSNL